MAFRRSGFVLTPPSVVIFAVSLVLAVLAFLVHYAHISVPIVTSVLAVFVLAGCLALTVGVLFRGI